MALQAAVLKKLNTFYFFPYLSEVVNDRESKKPILKLTKPSHHVLWPCYPPCCQMDVEIYNFRKRAMLIYM